MPLIITINSENAAQQNFPFRQSFINYILKSQNVKVQKKLYRSCKYFYSQHPHHIIDNLTFDSYSRKEGHESITFNQNKCHIIEKETNNYNFARFKDDQLIDLIIRKSENYIPLKNIWITGKIYCSYSPKRLPLWISKFSRCTIKELSVNAILTAKEFEILTKEGTIEFFNIQKVIYPNGNSLAVEDIVAAVPNALRFLLGYSHVTPTTLQTLCSMNRKQKFKEFQLSEIDNLLDENEYFELVKIYAGPGDSFRVSFAPSITKEMQKKFISSVNGRILFWKTSIEKPYVRESREEEF